MGVRCKHCGGDHVTWECRNKAKLGDSLTVNPLAVNETDLGSNPGHPAKSTDGERIGAQAVHGFSGGDAVQLGVSAVSNKPSVDTVPKLFDKKAWMREYMKGYMRTYRAKVKGGKAE